MPSGTQNSEAPNGTNVLQNEFVTWFRHDRHADAYAVLENDRSNRIAHNLGIGAPEKEPLCLKCHSTFPAKSEDSGPKFRKEDGVSCESCHGAASSWLPHHAEKGATHAENVANGLTDLTRITDKVKVCASCHLGNEEQFVSHQIMGAGHPRLTFEIDTYESVMPRHWLVDTDYIQRKGQNKEDFSDAKLWLVGQVVVASERLKLLASSNTTHHGIFPEFTNFACASCHHRLSDSEFAKRDYGTTTGIPRLNTPELLILSQALRTLDPARAQIVDGYVKRLHASYGTPSGEKEIRSLADYINKNLLPFATSVTINEANIRTLFKFLNNYSQPNLQYETAEQAAMGASALAAATTDKALARELKPLYDKLKDPDNFRKISPN